MILPRIENRARKYGYSNARVKGMKGLLLSPTFLEELIKVRKVEGMVELLQRTHYGPDVTNLSIKYSGSALIELAAISHFGSIIRKIREIAPKDDVAVIDALLRKWDLLNLKMLINAKRIGRSFEEMAPYLVSTGTISAAEYERIAKADEMSILEEIKKTSLGQEMLAQSTAFFNREMWIAFNNSLKSMDKFLQLQTIIDAYLYIFMDKGLLVSKNKDVERIRMILQKEVDARNILMIERLKSKGFDKARIKNYLLKGGTLSERMLSQLIEAKDLDAVGSVVKTRFPHLIINKKDTIIDLEIALEKAIAQEKLKAFHRSVLSIGVLLGFILLKEEELNNLRKIAKAKEFGISEEKIKEMLVVV